MAVDIVVVDFFLVVVFLAILPLPVRSFNAAVAAAALARVKRIDPLFSSFSLLTARCLTVRACRPISLSALFAFSVLVTYRRHLPASIDRLYGIDWIR